jgi:hypothetical protein
MNTGVSGFGTADELAFLEHEGMKYHPDVVVVAFFANDFEDNIRSNLYALKNDTLVAADHQYTPGVRPIALMNLVPGASWLSQNSYLFSLVVNTVWETSQKLQRALIGKRVVTEYAVRISDVTEYQQKLTVELLNRVKSITRSAAVPFVIVDIPELSPSAPEGWVSSIPPSLVPSFVSACDFFVPASSYMTGIKGPTHVPHGHHHITEEVHRKIAGALDNVLTRIALKVGNQQKSPKSE